VYKRYKNKQKKK